MPRKPVTAVSVEHSPALSAIEQLGRLIQAGTPVACVTRAPQSIACRWRATVGADAARAWITTLHADLASGAADAEELAGNVDRSDVGEARQANATLAAILEWTPWVRQVDSDGS
jgi:hypothetical protein